VDSGSGSGSVYGAGPDPTMDLDAEQFQPQSYVNSLLQKCSIK
jgi:hypothetical protein